MQQAHSHQIIKRKIPQDNLAGFLVRSPGLEPGRLPIRPSNVRVCLFRHDRILRTTDIIIMGFSQFVKRKSHFFMAVFSCSVLDLTKNVLITTLFLFQNKTPLRRHQKASEGSFKVVHCRKALHTPRQSE